MAKGKSVDFSYKTRDACVQLGWEAGVVSFRQVARNRAWGNSKDLFGFVDVLVVMPPPATGVLFIQATDYTNTSKRIRKIVDDETMLKRAIRLLETGNRLEVWSWKKALVGKQQLWDAKIRRAAMVDGEIAFTNQSSYLEILGITRNESAC